ncbi:MAG: polysaccharide deacetylase family protein [Bacteroidetes bacterium]|nr:polysaccharide deacetylase family protein [Bacteroidota bacterium]MBU1717627.1 polysaccharide deacetylase family protein [Bacteroidota bacterium]
MMKMITPLTGVKCLAAFSGMRLIAPLYHAVVDQSPKHIRFLYNIRSENTFKSDLEFFLRHYEAVDFDEFRKTELNRNKKRQFLITFDDGLREFHDIAAPILLQKGIPAICFLNNDFIGNGNMLFRFKASLIASRISEEKYSDCALQRVATLLETKCGDNQEIISALLSVKYKDSEILDQVAAVLEISFSDYLEKEKPYMDIDQIRSLADKGFRFGAHTLSHPMLKELDITEQKHQVVESMKGIMAQVPGAVPAFSFPFTDTGLDMAFFEGIMKEKGAPKMFFGASGIKKDRFPDNFHRLPVEDYNASVKEILKMEYLYYLARIPFRKHIFPR